jgi:[NiFe] hydrogenase assembly HybE family chaperone
MKAQAVGAPAASAQLHPAGPCAATLARVQQLEQVFAHIAATRMQGVPVRNAALQVQAIGFELLDDDVPTLLGILITPWFMNLLRLPLLPHPAAAVQPGSKQHHVCGEQTFEFIAAHEEALGCFEACSLFSPMFAFADQAGAVATANEIAKLLRAPPANTAAPERAVPSRRGFLLGRVRPGAAP